MGMTFRRRLPHVYPEGRWLFVTWHLHGSLPHGLYPPPKKLNAGQAFAWMDRYLDQQRSGPSYLRLPAIAQLVVDALWRGVDLGHYHLGAFVVMANHAHVLLFPLIPPSDLLRGVKGVSAYEANRALGRAGSGSGSGSPMITGCGTKKSSSGLFVTLRTTR